MNLSCVLPLSKLPNYLVPVTFPGSFFFLHNHQTNPSKSSRDFRSYKNGKDVKRRGIVRGWLLPVDPWAPNIDSESIASQLFAVSLFPYIGFLYFITKSKSAPKLTLFSFYFLLAFVGATIPAGIYGQFSPVNKNYFNTLILTYGCQILTLSMWLRQQRAESLVTLTNLFIVLGSRQAFRKTEDAKESTSSSVPDVKKAEEALHVDGCYLVTIVLLRIPHTYATYSSLLLTRSWLLVHFQISFNRLQVSNLEILMLPGFSMSSFISLIGTATGFYLCMYSIHLNVKTSNGVSTKGII